jgi:hypothetical protein
VKKRNLEKLQNLVVHYVGIKAMKERPLSYTILDEQELDQNHLSFRYVPNTIEAIQEFIAVENGLKPITASQRMSYLNKRRG